MSSKAIKTLGLFRKHTELDKGIGACLPEAYKKFYREWKFAEPTAVHYIAEEGKWKRDEITNQVSIVQNHPIALRFPTEYDQQMWGGEAVVQGYQKRQEKVKKVPHFWISHLQRSVIYSEILDKYIAVVVTDRAIRLINSNYGLDHYLLKTPSCDLKSLLPLGLKRRILQELQKQCPTYKENPEKQQQIYNKYKAYLSAYTPEEIDWYGYSLIDAHKKYKDLIASQHQPVPLKHKFRLELIEKLKEAQIAEASGIEGDIEIGQTSSWLQKINPFAKKPET